jgi:lipoate-protein ligase A
MVGDAYPMQLRFLVDEAAPGAWNMAVDEVLLEDAAASGAGYLRFYMWSEPTLSLGYFQCAAQRQHHEASRDCAVVRRSTGGGAILHDRELTYSLTLPARNPLAREPVRLYAAVHDAFIGVLAPQICRTDSRRKLLRNSCDSNQAARDQPFLCFERRACGDVLLIDRTEEKYGNSAIDAIGAKILGSAQRRHRGAVLQHGSLLLERSPNAPELAGCCDLTGLTLSREELIESLANQLSAALETQLCVAVLPEMMKSKALVLANSKFGSASWTNRR